MLVPLLFITSINILNENVQSIVNKFADDIEIGGMKKVFKNYRGA